MLALKQYYQIHLVDSEQERRVGGGPPTPTQAFKITEASDRAIRDRSLFEKKTLLQKEARAAFLELMGQEYEMMRLYRPHELVNAQQIE